MNTPDVFQEALERYRQIKDLGERIEEAIQQRQTEHFTFLAEQLTQRQEEAKTNDAAVLDFLRRQTAPAYNSSIRELLALMGDIHERNRRLQNQLEGSMAVHQDELQKLRVGNNMLQGYRAPAPRRGQLLSSAN